MDNSTVFWPTAMDGEYLLEAIIMANRCFYLITTHQVVVQTSIQRQDVRTDDGEKLTQCHGRNNRVWIVAKILSSRNECRVSGK